MPLFNSISLMLSKNLKPDIHIFHSLACRTDARTVSSGSSAWEGQLTSMVLSEYASTEMSIHALYMHEVTNACHQKRPQTDQDTVYISENHAEGHPFNFLSIFSCIAAQATIPWRAIPPHVAQAGEWRKQWQCPRWSEERAPPSLQKFPPVTHFPHHSSQPQCYSCFRFSQHQYLLQPGGGFIAD